MAKTSKRWILRTVCALLAAVLFSAASYLVYVLCSYYRVKDDLPLEVNGNGNGAVPVEEALTLLTYNIGFGAYSPDYSFFMDGGRYSRALSKDAVIANTTGALGLVQQAQPDFVCLQEVDQYGTRSYHVDQSELLSSGLPSYDRVFAQNYDSPYLFYPFIKPIGANRSGLMTFSRFAVTAATRQSLPVEASLYKYLDLDRAYSVSTTQTANGKQLLIYNVHLSAYTSDGSIADEQLKMLCADMLAAYQNGNYVIAAGDFNKDLLGDSSQYFPRTEQALNWAKPLNTSLLPSELTVHSGTNAPTCRNADAPYRGDGSDFVLSVDGLLVSPNVQILNCATVDTGFAYSDHQPLQVRFALKAA